MINEWNDQYSPRKTPSSRHINGNTLPVEVTDTDEGGDRPTGSPRKRTPRSPLKKDTKAYEAKKAFKLEKHELAKNFLEELDDTMTGGKVASMAASAGGIRIVWSKTLSSTAGRANWKREHLSLMDGDGVNTQAAHRHIASIELAEKVIDNEGELTFIFVFFLFF